MKKLHTLLLAIVAGASLLLAAGPLRPAMADVIGTTIDTSVIVNVSSQTASPSTLIAATREAGTVRIWCTQFANAGETVLVKGSTSSFSVSTTTGTARINCQANTISPIPLVLENYRGPVYAVANSSYPIPVNVLRKQ